MKNSSYLILITIVLVALGCNRNDQPYAFYRQSNPQNFITVKGAELYSYAANDSVLVRADYHLKLLGQIKTYGNTIIHYGHCWHPTNANPVIGIDTLMTLDPLDGYQMVGSDSISFTSIATRLKANTEYYLRSFVITDKDTGYNPVVIRIRTKDAIDEWFTRNRDGDDRPLGRRFDALGFNFGDSIFFGGGNQGFGNLTTSMWMYDPTTNLWNGDFAPLKSIEYYPGSNGAAFADGIGFGIEFTDVNAPIGKKTRCIYVGLGDYVGDDAFISKSNKFLEYDFGSAVPAWTEKTQAQFPSSRRSGAVCFVIGNRAYVGTGKSSTPTADWYVFYPELARDGDDETPAWRGMDGPTSVGRVGAVAFTLNGRGYFGLGYDVNGNFLNDFWEFRPNSLDATKGSWTQKTDFPGAPRTNAVGFAIGDQGYVGTGDNIVGDMEGTYLGETFEDFYRYDPFNDRWFKMRDYTSNKTDRVNLSKKITRAVGFSLRKDNVGYIGFGIAPDSLVRAQNDFWMYRPFVSGFK